MDERGKEGEKMRILENGATDLVWSVQRNAEGSGYRNYTGVVLAHAPHLSMHPYVTWTVASDDGITFWSDAGHYYSSRDEAHQDFVVRATKETELMSHAVA
tara:strand:+ start:483 stop:785 length:303 start_codon:yes stop_codon:yes gene_type:complete